MDGTEVITLGRLLQPPLTMQWLRPPVATSEDQNLPRPSMQNGPTVPAALAGRMVENLSLGNVGKVLGMLGQGGEASPYTPPTNALAPPAGTAQQQQLQRWSTRAMTIGLTLGAVSAAASAYHGYKRNNSLGWALVWATAGGFFPLITPAIGLAQGWGKRAR